MVRLSVASLSVYVFVAFIIMTSASVESLQIHSEANGQETAVSRLWTTLENIANVSMRLASGHNMSDWDGHAATVMKEVHSFLLSQDLVEKYRQAKIELQQTIGTQEAVADQILHLHNVKLGTRDSAAMAFVVIAGLLSCFFL